MRILLFILRKEFIQIFRDRMMLPMLLLMPLMQLLILPFAADMDVRHLKIIIVDNDHSPVSKSLISKFTASDLFEIYAISGSYNEALKLIETDKADIILQIPHGFERNLIREGSEKVAITADAINGVKAGLGTSYLNAIIQNFNQDIALEWSNATSLTPPLDVRYSFWYNPYLRYKNFIVPAILVLLVTVISGFVSALNIVSEKEKGTIEQINVTPIKKWEFIIGKVLPFWLIGIFDFSLGLLIMYYVYGIQIVGSLSTLYLFAIVYITGILGFGLLISTVSHTQQQSMFVAFFFIMIFILMSGMFTNVESMPPWAHTISSLIPVTHFMHAVRAIVLKGSVFLDLWVDMAYILCFDVVAIAAAVINYHKTV